VVSVTNWVDFFKSHGALGVEPDEAFDACISGLKTAVASLDRTKLTRMHKMSEKIKNSASASVLGAAGKSAKIQARLQRMTAVFNNIDIDGDGSLSSDEVAIFSKCLHGGKWSEKQTKRAMKALDKDENGLVTPAEFLEFYHQVIYDLEDKAFEKGAGEFEKAGQECKVQRRKNVFMEIFKGFDINSDGVLGADEVKILGCAMTSTAAHNWSETQTVALQRQMDTNKDGMVSMEEFLDFYHQLGVFDLFPEEFKEGVEQFTISLQECRALKRRAAMVQIFEAFDMTGDGALTRDEVHVMGKALHKTSWTEDQTDVALAKMDTDGNHKISLEEWVACYAEHLLKSSDEHFERNMADYKAALKMVRQTQLPKEVEGLCASIQKNKMEKEVKMATPVMYTSRMVAPVHTVQAVPVQLQAAPHVEEELIETLETAEPVMVMKAVACCRMLGEVNGRTEFAVSTGLWFDADGKLVQ